MSKRGEDMSMESEKLTIFDEHRTPIGEATREDVHKLGYWHEVFQCWFVSEEEGEPYIYLQKRSWRKKDYPNLFDITAAGHLLAGETVSDGVREIKEEIGIDVQIESLIPLGVIATTATKGTFIDKEIANVFLYKSPFSLDDFSLQAEEVSGMVKVEFSQFYALWLGELAEVHVEGFEIDEAGMKHSISRSVSKKGFVSNDSAYFTPVLNGIRRYIGV
ncbi:isopentenyldiphosphate isomerase [Pullulanibacillus pueri]|uniref:Putative Nudix hydrolase n=1 Tax=Pullulanibacillus pueri TaxID=1437324 RepID=A0A8J2ZRN9_9BACL|nr:NUDIX domain-containing protein [Pullulanibacillus pueri]MBM7679948.1 isopentenyldiphosphate isomerase [Pullulanibacillus pueri]GGH73626.1 putative Nudix hydrolase [Pullulanibacillus pueri]